MQILTFYGKSPIIFYVTKIECNYELSRGEICVANFKAPLQVKNGYLSQFVNMGSCETIQKVPMLKIIGLEFLKSNLNRGHFKKSV